MMGPQYTSSWVSINHFNIRDNVPEQIKESSLTFLVIGSEGRSIEDLASGKS